MQQCMNGKCYNEYMKNYDIIERTLNYGVSIIKLASQLPKTPAGFVVADQTIGSGTSVGANVVEAQDAISKKEFIKIINTSLKECRETLYWLELIKRSNLLPAWKVEPHISEGKEIRAILATIIKNAKKNSIN